jgi:hypothetical protein
MFGDAAGEIIGDTDVQGAVSLACEDVDEKGGVHAALPDVGIGWTQFCKIEEFCQFPVGPGSAVHRQEALHRVRDTSMPTPTFVHLHSVGKAAYLGRIFPKAAV